jgi:hypothetical protein
MLLVPVPWAGRVWALPFLSVLAPSERYAAQHGKQHKKITDWARQALLLVRRWWPEREIVAVADSAYASLRLLASCRRFLPRPVTFVTRLRLDAALYDPAPTTQNRSVGQAAPEGRTPPKPFGRRRGSGHRLGSCECGRLVWWWGAHRGGSLSDCALVQHGTARRVHTLGTGARSARCFRHPGLAVHRSWCRP